MAHWAKINKNKIVEQVIVVEDGKDNGQAWVKKNLPGIWVRTSYNTRLGKHILGGEPFRKNFALPGYTYFAELDAFILPKPEKSEKLVLDPETGSWIPGVPFPEDATWVIGFTEPPEGYEELEELRVYYWMNEYQDWGMEPCACLPPPPGLEENYYWNPLEKEWQEPDSESPGPEYYWNVIDKKWEIENI
jgi:hypothetical protein